MSATDHERVRYQMFWKCRLVVHGLGDLGGKGKAIMLRCHEGSASSTKREQGFLDVLKEKHPQIEVVSSNQYGGVTTESAYVASENLLAPLRKPDGGLAGSVVYVGFDSSERLVQALRSGHINGLVLQDPINMGYLGVKTTMAHLCGQKVEKRIDTGSVVATPENMDEPSIKSLLEPDFRRWLNE